MYPGLITSLSGAYRLDPTIDQDVQGWPIYKRGKLWGLCLDDTTPNLEEIWLPKAIAKYVPLGLKVMVCVPPGQPRKRYGKPIIAVYEWYPYGSGAPRSAWPKLPPRGFRAYVCQWNFPGVAPDAKPLTRRQRLGLLAGILLRHPRYVFKF